MNLHSGARSSISLQTTVKSMAAHHLLNSLSTFKDICILWVAAFQNRNQTNSQSPLKPECQHDTCAPPIIHTQM